MGRKRASSSSEPQATSTVLNTTWKDKWTKECGDVFISARQIESNDKKIVPVSPAIDYAIGGIPEGTWTIISGPFKIGKSSLALQIARNAQQLYGKFVFYIDAEGRFKQLNLNSVRGLNLDHFELVQSTQKHILTAEENVGIIIDIVKGVPDCVVIVDSVSALCSSKEHLDDVTGQTRSLGPKLMATLCRQLGTVVPVQNTILIAILHIIANTSGYGSPTVEDGGLKLQFQADIKLRGKNKTKWQDTTKKVIGQTIKWEVHASALGPPGGEIESYLRYGYGFDEHMELVSLSKDLGIIDFDKAWITITDPQWKWDTKFHGEGQLYSFLQSNQEAFKFLNSKLQASNA